jgi:hypothetical protein
MNKILFLFIFSLFLCHNLAFATSEPVGGIEIKYQGTVATVKDGFLPAAISLHFFEASPNDTDPLVDPMFFNGVMVININKNDKLISKTFSCTAYSNPTETSLIVTTTGTAIFSGNINYQSIEGEMVLQIPGEGITGKFSLVQPL